ncbi:hypothetical protein Back11_17670 [Paenibacillus baekrokdamisoli]|uniref:Uncharacterized protein n=1 Tax=Paenibacillus baekrokdamisoli TaxID=1712516 RepID=A0A3G9IQ74_9BACL|nr:hypothetical protein [Paenibacillus baekrokdamisoli]MBB3073489.1 hypothetical protein [Paenibacillus baekrokdamisoli]BBH20422.1 hypothetical protein Back11_17670 [Paenibacillus baekrokdamisoli]
MKGKNILYVVILLLGLLMISDNHLDNSFGDYLFKFIGLSPWTDKDETGLHLPALLGFSLLIFGVSCTVRTYRPRFPKILSRVIIGCIAFILICPIVSEKTMFLLKHNSKGINSLDFSMKDSKCNFQTVESDVKANCSFTIYNYGIEEEVLIKPILKDKYPDIENFEEHVVNIAPHRKHTFSVQFDGTQRNGTGFAGTLNKVGIELEVAGIRRKFE